MRMIHMLALLNLTGWIVFPLTTHAERDEIDAQIPRLEEAAKKTGFETKLKSRYTLTDVELKKLHEAGLNGAQITVAAQISSSAGVPIEEIVKMRTQQKMGWGEIAKTLGVPPKEIGESISAMHRNDRFNKGEKTAKSAREKRSSERKERKTASRDRR